MEKFTNIFDRRLLISACLLIVLAWTLFIFDQWVTHRNRITDQGNRAATLALAMEQRIERSLRVADQMLVLVREEIVKQKAWKDSAKQTRILEYLTPNLDEVFAVAFVSPDGIASALSNPTITPGRNHSDRDFYQFHLANSLDSLYLEKPFILASTGEGAFTVSRALRDGNGELQGIVLTVIRTEVLAREFDALRIGSNGSIGLHHQPSYSIIARQPMYYETAAQEIGDDSLRMALEKSNTGFFTGAISADNENRFFAYRKLARLPLVVTVGISHEDIDTELLRDLLGHFVTMLTLTALVAGGGCIPAHGAPQGDGAQGDSDRKNPVAECLRRCDSGWCRHHRQGNAISTDQSRDGKNQWQKAIRLPGSNNPGNSSLARKEDSAIPKWRPYLRQ